MYRELSQQIDEDAGGVKNLLVFGDIFWVCLLLLPLQGEFYLGSIALILSMLIGSESSHHSF